MQQESMQLNDLASTFRLKIYVGKTKVQSNPPNKEQVSIINQALEIVAEWNHLGNVVNLCEGKEEDIASSLGISKSRFCSYETTWKSSTYSRKPNLYRSKVLSELCADQSARGWLRRSVLGESCECFSQVKPLMPDTGQQKMVIS